MNVKWMAFFAFVWFFGMIMGAAFEGSSLETHRQRGLQATDDSVAGATAETTFEYLFDLSYALKETNIGPVSFKLPNPEYLGAWFGMFLLDFNFLKEYNTVSGEWHETTQSYFFKLIGTIGILCFILTFISVIQGFVTP